MTEILDENLELRRMIQEERAICEKLKKECAALQALVDQLEGRIHQMALVGASSTAQV